MAVLLMNLPAPMSTQRCTASASFPPTGGFSRRWLLAGGAAWLAGCASGPPAPRTLMISEARLVERLARQFPMERRAMDVFQLMLDAPRVRLIPDENRLGTELDYVLKTASWPGMRPVQGRVGLSYGLRIDPVEQVVRLHEVRVNSFDAPNAPPALARHASMLGGQIVEALLRDFVVYRIEPEDLRSAGGRWRYQPAELTVVPGGLQLRLDPVE
jgi:hypothetical protein